MPPFLEQASKWGRLLRALSPFCSTFFSLWAQMGTQASPFDPILVTFSLFFAYFFTASPQAKETKSYTPAAKKGQHSALFSRCKLKDFRWPQIGSAPKKGQQSALLSVCTRQDCRWPHLRSCPQQRGSLQVHILNTMARWRNRRGSALDNII